MSKAQETVLEIDLKALEHNYNFLRSKVAPKTKFLAVVKAFAYGHDAAIIAKKLEALGADYFAVAYSYEGVDLRKSGITKPILVLHPLPANFKEITEYHLEPNLYSKKMVNAFLDFAKQNGLHQYPVHLKFNTGLNRLGLVASDIPFLVEQLKEESAVAVVSLFSHLAASEDKKEQLFTRDQITQFLSIADTLQEQLRIAPLRHILNTSGILNYPEAQLDMVRSGIGLYGYGNDPKIDMQLKPVATLKTIISQINELKAGETVGYNRGFASREHSRTATLPIGHADGIGRQYGNGKAWVHINGAAAPIIGNVCMDMIMVDVTAVDCKEGDEVILFGKDKGAEAFAQTAQTISYELITGISRRIKRVVLD